MNKDQLPVSCRTLIDTCAASNFMTDSFAKRLGLPRKTCYVPIGVLNDLSTVATHTIRATIKSRVGEYEKTLTFLTVPNISSLVPDQFIDRSTIAVPSGINLADPNFHRPAPVEMLLGSGTALSMLCVGQIDLTPPDRADLFLQKTRVGWVIGGSAPTAPTAERRVCHVTAALQFDLAQFWEIEEGPQIRHLSDSEAASEQHYKAHTTRNVDGRYVVALPFNERLSQLGESRSRALKRFASLERKLQGNVELQQRYRAVIQEYLDLGHMSEITDVQASKDGYYLPHHGIIKNSSETTKLRVVFDASAKTSTGVSLNDALHIGPKIQDDLLYILLRFRTHQYVITGDIEKMYRQFLVRAEDRRYQRILWRDNDGDIKTFELNTVTFGVSAAPFLAIRCLKQLSQDEGYRYPRAAEILQQDFYVDDALTGASTREEALALRKDLTDLLKLAGLNVRQWASNDRSLLQDLPRESINSKLHFGETSTVKTLGVMWNSTDDSIIYSVKIGTILSRVTKRIISSEIARIYDPLGLLGPVIVTAKIMLQQIWTLKIDWDESLPMNVHTEWARYYSQLPLLNNIVFKRKTIISSALRIELHGFCDASEKAYGACVYLRTIDVHGRVQVELLLAKSRVAPLKQQTIPRLELCGALLLTSLVSTIRRALPFQMDRTILWTDSTIVLYWINTSTHTLKTFVANRIAEIQTKTRVKDWRHVRTNDNPADLISRGQTPEEFLQPSIWQHGPTWLVRQEVYWPTWESAPPVIIPEQKQVACFATQPIDTSLLDKYSSWGKLVRIVAFCLRWRRNSARGVLTVSELNYAHYAIIKLLQHYHFSEELRCIAKDRNAILKGKLTKLNPFIDKDGILRVGGRLQHSEMSFFEKHPIILPKAFTTALIIENEHRIHLHAGVQATLYAVRRRYWPIDGRSQVWKSNRKCVRCCRARPPPVEYIMGSLPEARVTESRPFTNVGVDYCGPFYIKEKRHRNQNRVKVYVAVFVCLAVKAVHLELVSDLTTDAFVAALRRFIARRGFCVNLYSDNGSNFVGTNNELRDLRQHLQSDDHNNKVQSFLAEKAIEWHFIPPLTPHFGGLWEAAVKSFKFHLKRVAGANLLTFEDFNTLIIEIESILNSRPLTSLSSDPNDLLVLTPGHFLIGDSMTSLRERDFRDTPANRLSSWQHIQKVKQHFWTRWHHEYLNELTSRRKWITGSHPIKVGTVVLLRDDKVPSMQWALGKVLKVHPGADGIVRTVTLRTATTELDRAVKKLVPLPNQLEDDVGEEDIARSPTSVKDTRPPLFP